MLVKVVAPVPPRKTFKVELAEAIPLLTTTTPLLAAQVRLPEIIKFEVEAVPVTAREVVVALMRLVLVAKKLVVVALMIVALVPTPVPNKKLAKVEEEEYKPVVEAMPATSNLMPLARLETPRPKR